MAKKSSRRPVKDQAGCLWGLINVFGFRHGRAPRKLLSNRRNGSNLDFGGGYPRNKSKTLLKSKEKRPRNLEEREESEEIFSEDEDVKEETSIDEAGLKENGDQIRMKLNGTSSFRNIPCDTEFSSVSISEQEKSDRSYSVFEENLMKILIDWRFENRNRFADHTKTAESKELMDSFLKSLHVKELEKLQNSNSSEEADKLVENHKFSNFFRRKIKNQESNYPPKRSEIHRELSRIVVLKPHCPVENKANSEKNGTQFYLTQIKRKLKNAMGKERRMAPSDNHGGDGVGGESGGWRSPNRNHFFTERFTKPSTGLKRRDKTCEETSGYSRQGVGGNIYGEAKKHLLEMLSNGDKDAEAMSREVSDTLQRILSLPEYSSSSSWSLLGKNREQSCSAKEKRQFEEIEGIVEGSTRNQEENEVLDDARTCDPAQVLDEERSCQCFKPDLFQEDRTLASPSSSPSECSVIKKSEDPNNENNERTEQPSPISVLEPLFTEDDISPPSTKYHPVETAIHSQQIHFEQLLSTATDGGSSTRICIENEETTFEYVEAVLLGSDLNWDEFTSRWLSSDQILDTSLFDEVELFTNQSRQDQKLLFDCTNEVLKKVCDRYLVLFVKKCIKPVPKGMDLINEVWEGVKWHLLQQPIHSSLDQLVKKDLTKEGTWMDLRFDAQRIANDMGESIFEELVGEVCSELHE